jgi:hypothetical protein
MHPLIQPAVFQFHPPFFYNPKYPKLVALLGTCFQAGFFLDLFFDSEDECHVFY